MGYHFSKNIAVLMQNCHVFKEQLAVVSLMLLQSLRELKKKILENTHCINLFGFEFVINLYNAPPPPPTK